MTTIRNPIIPGMVPDPSIIRVNEEYYIATSTFHWTPGTQLFKSTDLPNRELIDFALKKVKSIYGEQLYLLEFGHHIYPMILPQKNTG